jgi:hypothetical protein
MFTAGNKTNDTAVQAIFIISQIITKKSRLFEGGECVGVHNEGSRNTWSQKNNRFFKLWL